MASASEPKKFFGRPPERVPQNIEKLRSIAVFVQVLTIVIMKYSVRWL